MSFYFVLQTQDRFPTVEVMEALRQSDLAWVGEEPGDKVFYKTGKSLRGVCIYPGDGKIEVGLNAFTTRDDARLARDIVAAASRILDCPVVPESQETPISAGMAAELCTDAWIEDRYAEAFSVARAIADHPPDQQMKITGFCRGYAISHGKLVALEETGMTQAEAVATMMQEGITVQELDIREDIYAAKIMSITAPITKEKKGFFGKKTTVEKEDFVGFALAPGVRTLTPVFMDVAPAYAIMGDKKYGYRRVPYDDVKAYARQIGAREYGEGVFDLTVDGEDYNALYYSGEAM